ncbi:MAG: hypothetical protein ACREC9_15480 [Methylocella sp.]
MPAIVVALTRLRGFAQLEIVLLLIRLSKSDRLGDGVRLRPCRLQFDLARGYAEHFGEADAVAFKRKIVIETARLVMRGPVDAKLPC